MARTATIDFDTLRTQVEQFTVAVDDGTASADLLARFAHFAGLYSDRNAALIVSQCPTATDVAGYVAWKQRGRQVREGEHGIRILAPAGQDKAQVTEVDAAVRDGAGQTVRRYFRLVSVFDVAQTDPIEK